MLWDKLQGTAAQHRSHVPHSSFIESLAMSRSVGSLFTKSSESKSSLTSTTNESTAALIPKVRVVHYGDLRLCSRWDVREQVSEASQSTTSLSTQPGTPSSSSANLSTTTSTASTASTTTTASSAPPKAKDFESAYAQMAISMGFGGSAPQFPVLKTKSKKSDKAKESSGSSSTARDASSTASAK